MQRLISAVRAFFHVLRNPERISSLLLSPSAPLSSIPASKEKDREHLTLLSLLQKQGRFLDFLQEDLSHYSDAEIGIAARQIHQDCHKVIEEAITIRPLLPQNEGDPIDIPVGYDPTKIKLVGQVASHPPYRGVVQHAGWKAHKLSLTQTKGVEQTDVLMPAHVLVQMTTATQDT